MEKEINIADILRDKPKGTKLYSSAIGECKLLNVDENNIIIRDFRGNDYSFNKHGILVDTNGECTLFPSRQMKDWERFSWKRGDVLSCGVDNFCIFDSWANDDYIEFHSKFNNVTFNNENALTFKWIKVDDEKTIQQYISNIEEIKCGKLNLETLEIEPKPQFKNGDIVYVEGNRAIAIFKKSIKYEGFDYHACLYDIGEIEYDNFIITSNFRLATEEEKQQILSSLASIGKKWNPDTKQIENLPKKFKAFDKVLVRDNIGEKWKAQIFSHYNTKENTFFKYICVGASYTYCIPYEGNEHLLGTTDNYEE